MATDLAIVRAELHLLHHQLLSTRAELHWLHHQLLSTQPFFREGGGQHCAGTSHCSLGLDFASCTGASHAGAGNRADRGGHRCVDVMWSRML